VSNHIEQQRRRAEADYLALHLLETYGDAEGKSADSVAILVALSDHVAMVSGGDVNTYVNDMSFLLLGYDHWEGGIFPPMDRQAGLPLDSTGFGDYFRDPDIGNNQVNHFWFFVHVGYQLGKGPTSEKVLQQLALAHEDPSLPLIGATRGGGSIQDLRLSYFGTFLGMRLRAGEIAPDQVGTYLNHILRWDGG